MAITGVTCRITANGNRLISTQRDMANNIASKTPPTTARASDRKVSLRVNSKAANSESQFSSSVRKTTLGAGMM